MAKTKKKTAASIEVKGARTHNLKNIDVSIPLNKITCIWGPSGSGKSSLAFHTLLAESKRRYLNSLPNDIKFFWSTPQAADVDSIQPVLPAWGLSQNNPILSSRPTLADTISITDHLQVLYHRWSKKLCPTHLCELLSPSLGSSLERQVEGLNIESDVFYFLLSKEDYLANFHEGFLPTRSFSEDLGVRNFDQEDYFWEVFRMKKKNLSQLEKKIREIPNSSQVKLYFSDGRNVYPLLNNSPVQCPKCDFTSSSIKLDLDRFTPYSAAGACSDCRGHGKLLVYDRTKLVENPKLSLKEGAVKFLEGSHFRHLKPKLLKEMKANKVDVDRPFEEIETESLWKNLLQGLGSFIGLEECFRYLESKKYKRTVRIFIRRNQKEVLCESCSGTRINKEVHYHYLNEGDFHLSYLDCYQKTVRELYELLHQLKAQIVSIKGYEEYLYKVNQTMKVLETAISLDLGDLSLSLKSKSLTTSQYQRSLLVKILSYEGGGSLFILDEPSLGLSLQEQEKVFICLEKIKDQGNTILLVEHSEYLKASSDFLIEMGPLAGERGGEVLSIKKGKKKTFSLPKAPVMERASEKIKISSQEIESFKIRSCFIPLEKVTLIYGNSGSLKNKIFIQHLANKLYYDISEQALLSRENLQLDYKINKTYRNVYIVDSSVGNANSRSSVGTVLGFSAEVRKHYASLSVSKSLGLEKGHFSSNSELGRCPTCQGRGNVQIEMSFLEDITLECEDCRGMKLKPLFASISDGEQSVFEAFNRPMDKVIPRLSLTAKYLRLWELVKLLKLDYLSLERSISSLSGGERLRLKLLSQLSVTVYESLIFFENLSSGLSKVELRAMFDLFSHLKKDGNSLIILDENEELFHYSDHSIDLRKVIILNS